MRSAFAEAGEFVAVGFCGLTQRRQFAVAGLHLAAQLLNDLFGRSGGFDGVVEMAENPQPVDFVPQFFLESPEFNKVYPDRILPLAIDAIQKREDPNRRFFDTVDVAGEIPVGKSIWGVATWEDIDPRIDRMHVYVGGLTNAYRWVDPKDQGGKYLYRAGESLGAHRQLAKKMLQLNFWRPGDEYLEHEGEIRLGAPDEVDYAWAYR